MSESCRSRSSGTSSGESDWRRSYSRSRLRLRSSGFWAHTTYPVPDGGPPSSWSRCRNAFFRHLSLSPHLISLPAGLALLSLLVNGRWRSVFLASVLITWVHLSLFWVGPVIVLPYVLVRFGEAMLGAPEGRWSVRPRQALSAVFLGTVAGWLLRPHPIEAGLLANVRIIRVLAQTATEERLPLAAELFPVPFMELVRTSWLFLAAWLIVCIGTMSYLGRNKLRNVPGGAYPSAHDPSDFGDVPHSGARLRARADGAVARFRVPGASGLLDARGLCVS